MQLIGKPETTLDIEINMAAIESTQNNKSDDLKNVNLDIENLQDKKVNGNEQDLGLKGDSKCGEKEEAESETDLDLKEDSKCGEKEEAESVTQDSSVDVPMDVSDREVAISNENLGKQNEKINEKSQNGISASDSDQNDTMDIDESKETLEDDYLEDDIISFVQEPLKEITPEEVGTEKVTVENRLPMEEEIDNDKKEIVTFMEISTVDKVKDEKDINTELKSNSEQCTKDVEQQLPIKENDTDYVIPGNPVTIQDGQETPLTTEVEKDNHEIMGKTDSVHHESLIQSTSKDNDQVDIIDEPNSSQIPIAEVNEGESVKIAESIETMTTALNNESINVPENNEAVNTVKSDKTLNAAENNETGNNETVKIAENKIINNEEHYETVNGAENCETLNTADSNEAVNAEKNNYTLNTVENNKAVDTTENNEVLIKEENESVETAENNELLDAKKNYAVNSAENNKTVRVILKEENPSLICDINIVPVKEETEEDNIPIVDKIKSIEPVRGEEHCHVDTAEESKGSSTQKNIMDTDLDNKTENTRLVTDTLVSNSKEDQEIEIIENINKPRDQDENQTESHTEVNEKVNMIKLEEVVNTENTFETTKCNSDLEEPNTHSINIHADNSPMDVEKVIEDTKIIQEPSSSNQDKTDVNKSSPVTTTTVNVPQKPIICKLSNTLDILSDDDEELPLSNLGTLKSPLIDTPKPLEDATNNLVDLEDDDDIMVIDEDTDKTEAKSSKDTELSKVTAVQTDTALENIEKSGKETTDLFSKDKEETTTITPSDADKNLNMEIDINEKTPEPKIDEDVPPPPLIPDNFVKTAKKKLSDMTRDDLEEFCILKIVESLVDRSGLSDIQSKLKCMTQGLEEYKKKVTLLSRQNRDLQLVLKSVQEEQKKANGTVPITPLKITRSVGMQIYMEKIIPRKKISQPPNSNNKNSNNIQNKNATPPNQGIRPVKQVNQPQNIPVPRLVPANNPALKTPSTVPLITQANTTPGKNNTQNGTIKTPAPALKAEKRQHNKLSSSMTVDLTDDEPPTKVANGAKTLAVAPVRLVPPQNLLAPQRHPFTATVNSPRKVYIPISGPQSQALRPGQTIMLKTLAAPGMRPRLPQIARGDPNAAKLNRITPRHPAPLPCAMKQYQSPNWKSLSPAPDVKLAKVDNGIIISWTMNSVSEESYEEIASYQIYAYQETTQPPSTSLWKKIGDVKALPLPMACTLTKFMAGYKYYFAVRAVDIRSRFGPFSLPGSILLLNKNV